MAITAKQTEALALKGFSLISAIANGEKVLINNDWYITVFWTRRGLPKKGVQVKYKI